MVRPLVQPPRDSWRVEMTDQVSHGDHVAFEYVVRQAGREPFLLNNHRAQLRTDHQRIITNVAGEQLHESGVFVAPNRTAMTAFSQTAAYHRWVDRLPDGRWIDDHGRTMVPFLFPRAPWAGGGLEELDPQWQRETFTVPLLEQINQCIADFADRAEAHGWVGDRRGTTLNLQVGANSDDGMDNGTSGTWVTNSAGVLWIGHWDAAAENGGWRWNSATIAAGSTINTAQIQVYATSNSISGSVPTRWSFEAADNPGTWVNSSHQPGTNTITTATVDWDITSWAIGFQARTGLATALQEVINRGGWASGNSICGQARDNAGSANSDVEWRTYEGSSTNAAKLDIDYTAGGGTTKRLAALGVG